MIGSGLTILVVDDDRINLALVEHLATELGFEVQAAHSGEQAIDLVRSSHPNIVLSDLRMPGMDGSELLREIKHANPSIPVVIMSVVDSIDQAVELLRDGADDYIPKPMSLPLLKARLSKLIDNVVMHQQVEHLHSLVERAFDLGSDFVIGPSKSMMRCIARIPALAESGATVLIQGETGTGKELVARAIHHASYRGRGPLISVNCASIPEQLWEREFFGHAKGAFTDAQHEVAGMIQAADGGSLFLDEIGEIPLSAQPKLLRFLQDKEYRRVGDVRVRHADVRLISATNRDLGAEVRAGRFRHDLYYRINVVPLNVPPLRDRKEDIPQLADFFLRRHALMARKEVVGFSPMALQKLCAHDFPGNVRELENIVQQALVASPFTVICPGVINVESTGESDPCLCSGQPVTDCSTCSSFSALPAPPPAPALTSDSEPVRLDLPYREAKQRAIDSFERRYISAALAKHQGNVSQAAKAIQLSRKSLSRVMARHGLAGGPEGSGGKRGRPRKVIAPRTEEPFKADQQ